MMKKFFNSLIICALLVTSEILHAEDDDGDGEQLIKPSATKPLLIGYWQNFRNTTTAHVRLSEIQRGYSIVNIAFASVSPNGNVKFTLQGPPYKAMATGDALFKDDVKFLQRK